MELTNKTTPVRIIIKERYSKLSDDQNNLQSTDIQSQNHAIRLSSDSRTNHERICICSLSLASEKELPLLSNYDFLLTNL